MSASSPLGKIQAEIFVVYSLGIRCIPSHKGPGAPWGPGGTWVALGPPMALRGSSSGQVALVAGVDGCQVAKGLRTGPGIAIVPVALIRIKRKEAAGRDGGESKCRHQGK